MCGMRDILWGPKSWGLQEMFTGSGPKARAEANKQTMRVAAAAEQIQEEKRKKRIARAPIETVFGGSQVQQEGGVTLGQ